MKEKERLRNVDGVERSLGTKEIGNMRGRSSRIYWQG